MGAHARLAVVFLVLNLGWLPLVISADDAAPVLRAQGGFEINAPGTEILSEVSQLHASGEPHTKPTDQTPSSSATTKPAAGGGGGGGCPSQWTLFEKTGACYKAMIQKSSWLAAEMVCMAEGAHLVSIANKEENDFVAHMARTGVTGTPGTWIGLYIDDSNNQQWKWSDGEGVAYTKWKKGDPDKPLTEKCAELFPDEPKEAADLEQWNSNNCFNTPHSYVCKKKP